MMHQADQISAIIAPTTKPTNTVAVRLTPRLTCALPLDALFSLPTVFGLPTLDTVAVGPVPPPSTALDTIERMFLPFDDAAGCSGVAAGV